MHALLAGFLLAQAATLPSDTSSDLERIRKALAAEPAILVTTPPAHEGTVFHVLVQATAQKPVWDNWSHVPSYIRPQAPPVHYEFLEQVTPEEFRSATLYTVGIPVVALVEMLMQHAKAAHKKSQEAHAHEEVQQALAGLLSCRADPTRPGC